MVCKCGHADELHHVIGRDEELQHDKVVCEGRSLAIWSKGL